MKKITKLSKIFLVFVTIFSQLSSVVTVLADEITSKPLTLTLERIIDEEENTKYQLTYKSTNQDYVETEIDNGTEIEKKYNLKLTTKFIYLDNEVSTEKVYTIENVTGKTLNNTTSSYNLDPISTLYNGIFELNVKVLDEASIIYETDIPYIVDNSYKGLKGSLNNGEVLPLTETIDNESVAVYNVTDSKEYTQNLFIMPGELSPNSTYKFVYADGTMSEPLTGEEVALFNINGSTIDFSGKIYGEYKYRDEVTLVKVDDDKVLNTYNYSYTSTINYGNKEDNDTFLNSIYSNIEFKGDFAIVYAKKLYNTNNVITIRELLNNLENTQIELEVKDENDNVLDLTDENILDKEIRNNYQLTFISGAEAHYTVVVKGDNTFDNTFDSSDMLPTMRNYLNDEISYSMDMVTLNEETDKGELEAEAFGTITFEDIMLINELLKENGNTDKEDEDNQFLTLSLNDLPKEVFVGDSFDISLIINNNSSADYIDGLTGLIETNSNLKVTNIEFNNNTVGDYNDNGRFVLAGQPLTENDTIIMTITLMATAEGTGTIKLEGKSAKYLNIDTFETEEKTVEIIRPISTNNDLYSLNASTGTFDIDFDKDITIYTLTVPYDTKTVILSGSLADVNATVEGLIEYELIEDKTVAIITVTAEDGSIKTYTVYIVRANKEEPKPINYTSYSYSSNNYLKSLEIDNYEITFDKDVNEYKIKVKSDVTSLEIKALAEDSNSRVEITGNENFKSGENTVIITVTAEDGSTREYKIIVEKEKETKEALTEIEDSSNTAEKIVIIILIILVVLGLLYLIFKKDEEDVVQEPKTLKKETTDNNSSKQKNKGKK